MWAERDQWRGRLGDRQGSNSSRRAWGPTLLAAAGSLGATIGVLVRSCPLDIFVTVVSAPAINLYYPTALIIVTIVYAVAVGVLLAGARRMSSNTSRGVGVAAASVAVVLFLGVAAGLKT